MPLLLRPRLRWGLLLACAVEAGSGAAGCVPAAWAPAQAPVVYVVRHADRLDDTPDPPLSAAGHARAAALADSLARWGLPGEVWSTRYARTQQTAAPTARRAGVGVRPYGAPTDSAGDARALVAALRGRLRQGQRALVVGHSNTVPGLLQAFDGRARPDLDRADYDGLYVVTLRGGRAVVRRVRVGASDGVADPE